MKKPKTLYLIDSANYLFRAYYAIRGLSTSKGLPTNALFGYTKMLIKLLREERPDYVAACFDTEEPTFRDEMYEDYKAGRQPPPDDLVQQFPYVEPIVSALSIPVIKAPGFEADDIIGTLAEKFASPDLHVVVVSGDKDMMQLVGPHVSMLDEMKGLRIGAEQVRERFGVPPEKVVDVLAIAGDSSDNIPGVPGVGQKTASKLIQNYGSVEAVIENAGKIEGKIGKAIADNADSARLSRTLVSIDRAVEIKIDLKDLEFRGHDQEKMRSLFKELEFSNLLAELAPRSTISYEGYRLITEESALNDIVNTIKTKKILSIDLETDSLDPMRARIAGFSMAWEPGSAVYIPVGHLNKSGSTLPLEGGVRRQLPERLVFDRIGELLADEGIKKIGQNLNFDLTILRRLGFVVKGVEFDTMIASYLIDPGQSHRLDAMAARLLDHNTIKYEDVVGRGAKQKLFTEIEPQEGRDYACEDADVALRLTRIFQKRLDEEGLSELFCDMEMPLLHVLIDMQIAGMKVDVEGLARIGESFTAELEALEEKIYALADGEFKINSPKQLGEVLFTRLGLPGGKKTKTGYSTSQSVLEELAGRHELPGLVLRWRSLDKLKSTYVDGLVEMVNPETKRVHTTFNQATAATGRLSSSDPNLQNIPARSEEGRRIRAAFVAEPGFVLVSADYSQIELRVLAQLSGEEELVGAFKSGVDVHSLTASGIFNVPAESVTRRQRDVGKTVNFATIYGQGAYGLSRQLSISPGEAAEYIEGYFARYPRVAAFREEVLEGARRDGMVSTIMGRRRFFPDINSSNGALRVVAERMAFNTVFQGSAADIIKLAMIEVHVGLGKVSLGARLIMQVHDELVVEAPEADAEEVGSFLKEKMEKAVDLSVPLVVDIGTGRNWADAH